MRPREKLRLAMSCTAETNEGRTADLCSLHTAVAEDSAALYSSGKTNNCVLPRSKPQVNASRTSLNCHQKYGFTFMPSLFRQ